ncbi:hypothetical protein HPP92_013870 [Vanilla planifolia]|uniref:Aquaporin SIP2-1 n=1 Tax=Vanilla planifolia TaxID=51239 RepID=A0A835QT42_VANPL|nr:hypothetical protein HPP92_013870 [Vanilla planifolia]
MARLDLLLWDLVLSFFWVWSGALVRIFVYSFLLLGRTPEGEALKVMISILYMFFFAWLGVVSKGGAYNPLTVLSSAFNGGLHEFLFTAFGRIPLQVIGSVVGVKLVKEVFPVVGHGARLNVKIHHGALTEGILTFMIVTVSLGLKNKDPKSFFMNTWISTIAKLALHVLGSDLTGGIMNPASAFGWAYARGDHITLEHFFVYWLAPIQATILSVWAFRSFIGPKKSKKQIFDGQKVKAD